MAGPARGQHRQRERGSGQGRSGEPGPGDQGLGPQDHASTGKARNRIGGDRMGERRGAQPMHPERQRTKEGPRQRIDPGPIRRGRPPTRRPSGSDQEPGPTRSGTRQSDPQQPEAAQIAERAVQSVTGLDRPAKGTTRAPFLGGEYSTGTQQSLARFSR